MPFFLVLRPGVCVCDQSNPLYITYIIGGCVVLEFAYGKVGDGFFNWINKGVSVSSMVPW